MNQEKKVYHHLMIFRIFQASIIIFLILLLSLLVSLVFFLFLVIKYQDEPMRKSRESYVYQSLLLNKETEQLSYGISSTFEKIEEQNSKFTEFDQHYELLSNFGEDEYSCSGVCSCETPSSPTRRNAGVIFTKPMMFLVTALSSALAVKHATDRFRDECSKSKIFFDDDDEDWCESEVEECEYVPITIDNMHDPDGSFAINFWCKGICSFIDEYDWMMIHTAEESGLANSKPFHLKKDEEPGFDFYELPDPKEEEKRIKALYDDIPNCGIEELEFLYDKYIGCKSIKLESAVVVMERDDARGLIEAHRKFKADFLDKFCIQNSQLSKEDNDYILKKYTQFFEFEKELFTNWCDVEFHNLETNQVYCRKIL